MGHIKKLSGITTYQIPYIRTILNTLGETSKITLIQSGIILSMSKIHLILKNQPKKEISE